MSARRCEHCDRPKATAALYTHPEDCACARCYRACWSPSPACSGEPVDWRKRALAAERALRAMREAGVKAFVARCAVTGNPCGTDARMRGAPCLCEPCAKAAAKDGGQ